MSAIVFTLVFATVLTGLISCYHFSRRSAIDDLMGSNSGFNLKTLGQKVWKKLPKIADFDLETTLRLAGQKWDAEQYVAFVVLLLGGGLCAGIILYILGLTGPGPMIGLPGILALLCCDIFPKASKTRNILKNELFEFTGLMRMIASAGVAVPEEVAVRKCAAGRGILAREMQFVVIQMDLNTPLHEALEEHFVQRLKIDDASDIVTILRDSAIRGTSIVEPLQELYRDFWFRRENDAEHRLNRIAVATSGIAALTVSLGACIMIAGPFALSSWEVLMQ